MRNKFTPVKTAKKHNKSSNAWIKRQINDPFVKQAKEQGLRSRAAFKIMEIDNKFKIFKKGKIVLDLGSAPGGWSQAAVEKVGKGKVFAVDILPMQQIEGVEFLQQDFLDENAPKIIIEKINIIINSFNINISDQNLDEIKEDIGQRPEKPTKIPRKCDVVLSDMAENTCGDAKTDHLRIVGLLEAALDFSFKILAKDGIFVGKIFQGGASADLLKQFRQNFKTVKHFKPKSSRKESAENYIVAIGFKG